MKKIDRFLIFLIVIFLSILVYFKIIPKIKIDNLNKSVLLTINYEEIENLASLKGLEISEILSNFKRAGLKAVILKEDTPFSLENEGKLAFFTGAELKSFSEVLNFKKNLISFLEKYNTSYLSFLVSQNSSLLNRVKKFLDYELGGDKLSFLTPYILLVKAGKFKIIDLKRKMNELEIEYDLHQSLGSLGCGIDKQKVDFIKSFGLEVIPKIVPGNKISSDKIIEKISETKKICPDSYLVIFDDEHVLGYPDKISYTAFALKKNFFSFGLLELVNQKGEKELAKLMNNFVFPLHTVSLKEARAYSPELLTQRLVRAVVERGVRILVVPLIYKTDKDISLLDFNTNYLEDLKNLLGRKKIECNQNFLIPLALYPVKIGDNFIMNFFSTSIVFIAVFLLIRVFKLKTRIVLFIFLVFFLIFFLSFYKQFEIIFMKFFSLVTAIVFASLAMITPFSLKELKNPFFNLLKKFIICLFFAVTGGILISCLLSHPLFILRIEHFSGVKLSLIMPFLFFLIFIKKNVYPNIKVKAAIKKILNYELKIFGLLLLIFGFVITTIYLLRSGNEFRQFVPDFEIKLRGFFEKLFGARPRIREIFIGYPALIFSLMFYKKFSKFTWYWLFGLIGGLVPVSIINSFCHVHTPFLFILLRVFNGFWVGVVIFVIYLIIFKIFHKIISVLN